ncbi:hypothetical protein SAMCFNEI73_pB0513 (plasmid) [Sinorhizobium americanum]|uniref:Uncharacterized protein n=1 Tax=Sinorhizobium americanum TaxID=194963 RepID=A0A1L3LUE1_9HYPH|nr:hypothetical protein SAMCFNEI73_pB0513 [Sinorhizobium americanum]
MIRALPIKDVSIITLRQYNTVADLMGVAMGLKYKELALGKTSLHCACVREIIYRDIFISHSKGFF